MSPRAPIASISSITGCISCDSDCVVLAAAAVGHRVQLGLGPVDEVVGLALPRGRQLRDAGGRITQSAQRRLGVDDVGVEAGVRSQRDSGQQVVDVRRPAQLQQLTRAW